MNKSNHFVKHSVLISFCFIMRWLMTKVEERNFKHGL